MDSDTDRVEVRYAVPFGDGGRIELHVTAPLACAQADRAFILDIMDRVAAFAGVLAPDADPPAVRVLRPGQPPEPGVMPT